MKLFKLISVFILTIIFVFLTSSVVTVAQVPLYTFPADDGTKSYYVTGGNGVNIFVDEKGDPTKTTIIFSSGFLTSRTSWNSQWFDPKFYEKFHLIRYDYRGIGKSDKPKYVNSYSHDLIADDIYALINKLKTEYDFKNKKIVLVGWSIGVPLSLNFMRNYPNIKIDGFVSVCGTANNTSKLDSSVASAFQDVVDPQENLSKVVSGLNKFLRLLTFKPFSDELHSFFLGNSVITSFEYRMSGGGKYKKKFSFNLIYYKLIN
jgi:pimeloyl-ACP methyl ester carboxylesterase